MNEIDKLFIKKNIQVNLIFFVDEFDEFNFN